MESTSFYKRFKNRMQFVNKEGVLKLGVLHVSKKAPSTRKVHSDTSTLLSASISPSNKSTPFFPSIYHNSQKSLSFMKYACICGGSVTNMQDLRYQSFETPEQTSSIVGYSRKKRKVLHFKVPSGRNPETIKNIRRNNSVVVKN